MATVPGLKRKGFFAPNFGLVAADFFATLFTTSCLGVNGVFRAVCLVLAIVDVCLCCSVW